MKKILIVNDEPALIAVLCSFVELAGYQAVGFVVTHDRVRHETRTGSWKEPDYLQAVREADVVLLDHNLAGETGDRVVRSWKALGLLSPTTRIIGTSSGDPQEYLRERVPVIDLVVGGAEKFRTLIG